MGGCHYGSCPINNIRWAVAMHHAMRIRRVVLSLSPRLKHIIQTAKWKRKQHISSARVMFPLFRTERSPGAHVHAVPAWTWFCTVSCPLAAHLFDISIHSFFRAEAVMWAVGATALVSFALTLFAMQSKVRSVTHSELSLQCRQNKKK